MVSGESWTKQEKDMSHESVKKVIISNYISDEVKRRLFLACHSMNCKRATETFSLVAKICCDVTWLLSVNCSKYRVTYATAKH